MAQRTSIEWATKTWGPTKGCSLESPGCENCYAMDMAHRFDHEGGWSQGLTRTIERIDARDKRIRLPRWTGVVEPQLHKLDEPLRWRGGPHLVFVNSMSDLFHPKLPTDYILAVLGVIMFCPGHTFQVLTKRPENMRRIMLETQDYGPLSAARTLRECAIRHVEDERLRRSLYNPDGIYADNLETIASRIRWPVPNLWLGTSVEDRPRLSRIDALRATPAALRFVSFEPLLEDLGPGLDLSGIDWVIIGGESGRRARPCRVEWISSIVEQSRAQGVSVFVKQMGKVWAQGHRSESSKGQVMEEWPEALRIREFPA